MKTSPLLLGIVLLSPFGARAADPVASAEFDALVKRVYNFNPTRLSEAQWKAKEKQLDHFWIQVKAKRDKFLPYLRAKIANPRSDRFFRYDGVNLLVDASPSLKSKKLQVEVYSSAKLDFIEERRWVAVLTARGTEGFDVSKAARRTFDDEKLFVEDDVSNFEAAHFLWCSLSEERATPQLFAIANDLDHPQRESALSLLLEQATPQARDLVMSMNQDGLSDEGLASISEFLRSPGNVVPRSRPKISRAQFLRAFNDVVKGDYERFEELISKVPDGERDAAAVMLPADLPLLRRVRRRFLRGASEMSLAYYHDFTGIIFAVMNKQARIA